MNKKEGIGNYKLGQKVAIYGYIDAINIENRNDIENTTTLEINTPVKTISVNPKYEVVTTDLDKPKPVVPQFVAEWIESQKESFSDASAIDMYDNLNLDNNGGYYHEVWLWVIAHHHDFIKAWHDGYTVEQEKLYTVELPNPNGDSNRYGLCKVDGRIIIGSFVFGLNKASNTKLTESEIREDFDWAWQFAKEVVVE